MSATMRVNAEDFERLQKVLENFPGNSEKSINDVLHGEGGALIQESIRRLIPESGKTWKGKAPPARSGNSLMLVPGNLSVTTQNTKRYQYLYFPNDGTNTRRHAGNQQFFPRGVENVEREVVDRCIENIINKFNEGE